LSYFTKSLELMCIEDNLSGKSKLGRFCTDGHNDISQQRVLTYSGFQPSKLLSIFVVTLEDVLFGIKLSRTYPKSKVWLRLLFKRKPWNWMTLVKN